MMRTSNPKAPAPHWYIVDATGLHLGRLAAEIAHILRGKHKPNWSSNQVFSDHIIITNASLVVLAGKKSEQKVYRTHSGYLGHLKTMPYSILIKKKPEEVILQAVHGMLPHNRLRPLMLKHLHIYRDAKHGHEAQQPVPMDKARASSIAS